MNKQQEKYLNLLITQTASKADKAATFEQFFPKLVTVEGRREMAQLTVDHGRIKLAEYSAARKGPVSSYAQERIRTTRENLKDVFIPLAESLLTLVESPNELVDPSFKLMNKLVGDARGILAEPV